MEGEFYVEQAKLKVSSCVEAEWIAAHPGVLEQAKAEAKRDRGHPYPPGSGPRGESCGSCGKLRSGGELGKRYFKCNVLRGSWTGGAGTDVRKKDPACLAWEARTLKVEVLNVRSRVGG